MVRREGGREEGREGGLDKEYEGRLNFFPSIPYHHYTSPPLDYNERRTLRFD